MFSLGQNRKILRLFVLTYLFAAILVVEQKFTGTQNTELT
jgi:hypothetical protein